MHSARKLGGKETLEDPSIADLGLAYSIKWTSKAAFKFVGQQMVPWVAIIGTAAQAVLPKHRTLILTASALASLLLNSRRRPDGKRGLRANKKSFVAGSGGVKLEWRNLTCKLAGKKGAPVSAVYCSNVLIDVLCESGLSECSTESEDRTM